MDNSGVDVYINENSYSGVDLYQWKCADLDTSTLPTFSLMLDGNWFDVTPDDYVKEVDDSSLMCTFCMEESYSISSLSYSTDYTDTIVLGTRFLENWYTIFDYDNYQVGFTPLMGNGRTVPAAGSTPTTEMPRGVSLVKHDPINLITVPLGVGTFAAGFWTAYRVYQYYIAGDDKFWVWPWDQA